MAGNGVELLGGLFLGAVSTNEKNLVVAENVHGCKSSGAKKNYRKAELTEAEASKGCQHHEQPNHCDQKRTYLWES